MVVRVKLTIIVMEIEEFENWTSRKWSNTLNFITRHVRESKKIQYDTVCYLVMEIKLKKYLDYVKIEIVYFRFTKIYIIYKLKVKKKKLKSLQLIDI